jgi:hypothetical protein
MRNILVFFGLVLVETSAQAVVFETLTDVELTPGEYEIRCVTPTRERPCWRSTTIAPANTVLWLNPSGSLPPQPTESSVILDRNSENYPLREIRVRGYSNSFWIPGKPAVRERDREAMSASVVVNARTAAH